MCLATRCLQFGRAIIKDYALTIAVFVAIAVGYSSPSAQNRDSEDNAQYIPHITLPTRFAPTYNNLPEHAYTDRDWWVGLSLDRSTLLGEYNGTTASDIQGVCGQEEGCGFKGAAIVYAAIAAIPITFWFYFDQLFSCLLHQIGMGPEGRNLEKGAYVASFPSALYNQSAPPCVAVAWRAARNEQPTLYVASLFCSDLRTCYAVGTRHAAVYWSRLMILVRTRTRTRVNTRTYGSDLFARARTHTR